MSFVFMNLDISDHFGISVNGSIILALPNAYGDYDISNFRHICDKFDRHPRELIDSLFTICAKCVAP